MVIIIMLVAIAMLFVTGVGMILGKNVKPKQGEDHEDAKKRLRKNGIFTCILMAVAFALILYLYIAFPEYFNF